MILDRILASKRTELEAAKALRSVDELRAGALWGEGRRGFRAALAECDGRAIVAEIKKASPSKGLIRADFDPSAHARSYERAGAACLSVLTDGPFFQGSLADLEAARAASTIPVLRKDFTIDSYQVVEARAHGADAVLLIVAALTDADLALLLEAAAEEGLDALAEVHDEGELARAAAAGAALIGINNRNLETFETSLDVTRRLAGLAPRGATLISESGLSDPLELDELEALGVHGFLIGESLMRQPDPGTALERFLGR